MTQIIQLGWLPMYKEGYIGLWGPVCHMTHELELPLVVACSCSAIFYMGIKMLTLHFSKMVH